GRAVHETYTFSDTNITTPGVMSLIGWVRSGCAFAIANHGESVMPRQVVQALLDRLPKDAAYDEKRQMIRGYLKDSRYFDDMFYRTTLPFN
ncbi:MAG: hypothetical protein JF615_15865, partial [Asticcacaulis sp.]|nr:hypothetical protein [Asticcacaulis sp.]